MIKLGSAVALGALVLLTGAAGNATQTNVSGTVCTNFNASQALDIDYFTSGVRNINAASRPVVCAVPRNPLPAGATTGTFFVDGSNSGGQTTSGSINSFNFTGAFLGSQSFSSAGTTYDIFLSFPAAQLPTFAYVSTFVTLPASGQGVFFGTTVNQ
jgi:hypothetical protein